MISVPFPREALAAAAYRFEQANGNRIQLTEFDEIMLHKLTQADPGELAAAVIATLTAEEADTAYRSSAYFALGKRADDELLQFFRDRLRAELDQEEFAACYQVMIALDNLDEEIFAPERAGGTVIEHSLNARDAAAYLDKIKD